MRLRPALALIAFAIVGDARAQTATPMLVRVFGEGTVRVRISEWRGRFDECDDHRDRFIFDGRMTAGEVTWMSSPTSCVCMQHTWGGFRDIQWSGAQMLCPYDRRRYGGGYETFIRVDVSTEHP